MAEGDAKGFWWAIKTGDLDGVKAAVAGGESVNQTDATTNKRTPLHHAADFGQDDILEFFLSKGANVNAKDRYGITPLLAAVYEGHTACVEKLLAKGADPSAKGPDGKDAFGAADKDAVKKALAAAKKK
eukprot:TRINITY_DN27280_c0_g1_i1.p1 TRINITY_DN27280_c0_g1~~TRINITY_DN27280_c0_g1_i1.p1  ORF type:complete len:129 (-),score=45.21 TRINITY_DN27280_c0_g1_i1:34-420(-)